MLLEGKVAIITGAGSGFGHETAQLFAHEGARVIVADVAQDAGERVAAELRERGGEARFAHVDVRRESDLVDVVALAEATYGRLDIMVANAGILGRASFRPSETVTDEDFAEVIDVNLSGAFRSFRAAIPALRRAGGGALSATSSLSGEFATLYRVAYSASKGGIGALVRSLAAELAPERIRANAVCPALGGNTGVPHNIMSSVGAVSVERPDSSAKDRVRWVGDGTSSAAKTHLFLCSDLGNYISGETLVCDGGFSRWNGT